MQALSMTMRTVIISLGRFYAIVYNNVLRPRPSSCLGVNDSNAGIIIIKCCWCGDKMCVYLLNIPAAVLASGARHLRDIASVAQTHCLIVSFNFV